MSEIGDNVVEQGVLTQDQGIKIEKPPDEKGTQVPSHELVGVVVPLSVPQEPEVVLAALMREYKENSDARNRETESTLAEIKSLTSYLGGLAEPYDMILGELQGKIQALMFARKERFICESGKITYFKPGMKRSWDLDALDNTCNFDSYVKQMIWMHRKESPFDARIQIKVEG